MSDQMNQLQAPKRAPRLITAGLLGAIILIGFLHLNVPARPSTVEEISQIETNTVTDASFADVFQTIEEIGFEQTNTEASQSCFVSELGVPIVIHEHWQSAIPHTFDGFYLHDLFYRTACPNGVTRTLEFNR